MWSVVPGRIFPMRILLWLMIMTGQSDSSSGQVLIIWVSLLLMSTDSWPSHSSVFGIIDLASLPKDRFYLYRSLWNKQANTLHVLPHWTWPGREGRILGFVYTSYPSAELFVNGKSYGKQRKLTADESRALEGQDSLLYSVAIA